MAASTLGDGITLGSEYSGTALVYGSAVGVDQSGPRLVTRIWTPVLPVIELDGQPQRVQVDGVGVVLHRDGGDVLAVGDR